MSYRYVFFFAAFNVALTVGSQNIAATDLPPILGKVVVDCTSDSDVQHCIQAGKYLWNRHKIGDSECLRKAIPIREIRDKNLWDTHGFVSLNETNFHKSGNPACAGPSVPNVPKHLFVQSINKKTIVLHVDLADGPVGNIQAAVDVPMEAIASIDKKKVFWLYGTDKKWFDYYLYMLDDNPNDSPIDKKYLLEIFPAGGGSGTPCDTERPGYQPPGTTDFVNLSPDDTNVCQSSAIGGDRAQPQQINSGGGGEPDHP